MPKLPIPFDQMPDDALVREHVAQVMLGVSRSTLHRYVSSGLVPAPVIRYSQGHGYTAWRLGDLRAHLRRCGEGKAPCKLVLPRAGVGGRE
jgi:predicted DNA-binding transcriptional regulator AlpA